MARLVCELDTWDRVPEKQLSEYCDAKATERQVQLKICFLHNYALRNPKFTSELIKTENKNEKLVFSVQITFLLNLLIAWLTEIAHMLVNLETSSFYPEKFECAFLASCDDFLNKQIRSFQNS